MKKYFLYVGLFLFVTLLVTSHFLLKNEKKRDKEIIEFEQVFNQKLPDKITFKEIYNSYCSFPYEGVKLYSYSFSGESVEKFISEIKTDSWNSLPLMESLNLLIYGGSKNNTEYMYHFANEVGLPEIKNGYWKFINRNKNTDLLNYSAYNFSLAIYDSDNNILYFFRIDT
ncbi:hypothetical protein [Anaeromicropila herbilytica]|uniref:Uncharacterized protein n=1 Tax=Anaeromicropila herbilytica TaxID=2785025 RepID=A0A7R7ICT8_9FIRM|nr:hypothetical protein [Anaeromicropila herbilytica]BCN31098.1 hypothetical protein bsdtb5_23930 [Anaeromicropila herbilytica]